MQPLKFKKLNPNATIPTRATEGAAGMDLYVCLSLPLTINPGNLMKIPTGVAVEIPEGFVGLLFVRSGLAIKHGIALSNGVGVIDSDYRGEIQVGLFNSGSFPYVLGPGERFAQLVVMPVGSFEPAEAYELSTTLRGDGGLGSTGH